MKDQSNQSYNRGEEKVKLPWEAELEVKDLISPIKVRRIRLIQTTGAVLLLLALGVFGWWLFFAPPSGEKIVKQMIAAAGGMDEWNGIQDGNFVRIHRLYDENGKIIKQSEETFFFKNNPDGRQLLIKSKTNEGDQVIVGRDKGGFWASLNNAEVDPEEISKDLEFMCDGDGCSPLCASEMALYRMSFPFKLADYGVKPRNAGNTTLNGEKVILLDVTFDPKVGHDRWVFYVDPNDKLIRKIEHYPSLKSNVQPEEIYLSDFKKEGNIVLSHSNKYYRSNGKILEEYLISDVKFNSSLAAEIFDRPQQLSMVN
ncbi:MAG: hypothetical protein H0V30_00495 [Chitinophagaceae bacterium]|jgi:hypothetical protein|nr:hypothetical protein [Chitinophagaceae bacterium]